MPFSAVCFVESFFYLYSALCFRIFQILLHTPKVTFGTTALADNNSCNVLLIYPLFALYDNLSSRSLRISGATPMKMFLLFLWITFYPADIYVLLLRFGFLPCSLLTVNVTVPNTVLIERLHHLLLDIAAYLYALNILIRFLQNLFHDSAAFFHLVFMDRFSSSANVSFP